jgi:hypothetical protein
MLERFSYKIAFALVATFALSACTGGGVAMDPSFSEYPDTPFTIHDESDLIGGPMAQGRIGDVLLKNDRISVIIQKPRKNASVNSFGGNIIDADIVRSGGEGQDNFGSMFPLVNIEWTVNNYNYEAVSDGVAEGVKVLRAYGRIDVYDYLDLDFIGDVAEGIAGQRIDFSNRFDDRRNPFDIYEDMKGLSHEVVTDFTLEPGKNFVKIESTYTNNGDTDVKLPIGQIINGSGQVSMLVPKLGFSPDLMTQIGSDAPAVIYAGFDGVDVSYGYFYELSQFSDPETGEANLSTSVGYSDVMGIIMGEEFLKLAPLGGGEPEINFFIPANGKRTVTGYFVVGNGSAGSVMDSGLDILGATTRSIDGVVRDSAGQPVSGATVAVVSGGGTLITYRSDSSGRFAGNLPTGSGEVSRRFGNGKYSVEVDVPGYHLNGTSSAGSCDPGDIDLTTSTTAHVTCTLGETGVIKLTAPVIDSETGGPIPARLTIVGEDPSPNKVGSGGRFRSTIHWEPIFGIADLKYITVKGTFDMTGDSSFNLEPGTYRFVISHGPEYTAWEEVAEVVAGETLSLSEVKVKRAVPTPGYISADLHIHSVTSADSKFSHEMRVLSAASEALDVLQSSDHDYLTDFAPVFSDLVSGGYLESGSMQTCVGQEVTPNHYGHYNAFPLIADPSDPDGGAFDWSGSDREEVSPAPDYGWTLDEAIGMIREEFPGEQVIQVNHIMDNPTGLLIASGWVTSPYYQKDFGVAPLSSYADPLERRLPASSIVGGPYSFGTTGLMTTEFDAMELVVSPHLHNNDMLFRSALPTWFNLLNLGYVVTATANSDSHRGAPNPVGLPRNYIASSVDPRDGIGSSHSNIDLQEYAHSIQEHRVTVSTGPYVMMNAVSENGGQADIGGTLSGRNHTFTVDVKAPSWGWFDTIEIYANTEPVPVDDETDMPMQGTAADPALFYKPYHAPRYTYQPTKAFKVSDGTLVSWKEEDGVISASITFDLEVSDDTWVVALARGTRSTEGYRSLFPIVTNVLVESGDSPEGFDPADLTSFHGSKKVGASAWGLANPIFVDVDGDGFTAKYVASGISPL